MCRAVQYCLNVCKRFRIFPILFIVCISKIESKVEPSQNCTWSLWKWSKMTKWKPHKQICQATQSQFEKIVSTVIDNRNGSSNTPPEATTPMELPKDFDGASCSTNFKNEKLMAFVNTWKQNNNGRMSWSACWEEGKKKGLFTEYSNSHSF
ncbi:hypothetical protein BDF20DRAFT_1002510 [Mycotypha africana]|uniref:uncharacterized protein n=1 Tax=Mycotypha africana TaxID=64632 RepID=UPI002301356C|nr:uncharacterized protein BDF20DRAFT_1002510 [Mycotypha africana]KAI8973567.1 hypothetical protein BDF20DRAFT_1002510 [Mycotypha africana]